MQEDLNALATQAESIRQRVVAGTTNEFDRARLLRDMQSLATGLRAAEARAHELFTLIVAAGGDDPAPCGPAGGRVA